MKLKSLELFLLFRVFYSSLGWLVIRSFRTDYFLQTFCNHNAIVIFISLEDIEFIKSLSKLNTLDE